MHEVRPDLTRIDPTKYAGLGSSRPSVNPSMYLAKQLEGYDVFGQGRPVHTCPYDRGWSVFQWKVGWHKAQQLKPKPTEAEVAAEMAAARANRR